MHRTAYHFPDGAARLSLLIRLWPQSYPAQIVRDWQVTVNGDVLRPTARNAVGEQQMLWSRAVTDAGVEIVASGVVETEDRAGVVKLPGARTNSAIYLRATDLTRADKAIRDIIDPPEPGRTLRWLHDLRRAIHARIRYEKDATTSDTSAIAAMKLGRGVCQDMAHVFVAAARAHGVPARYVTGYQFDKDGSADAHEPHAWGEAWIEAIGWIGFDPSADECPTERYVRLTSGLDSLDAAPVRGHALGGTGSPADAAVRMSIAPPSRGRMGQRQQ